MLVIGKYKKVNTSPFLYSIILSSMTKYSNYCVFEPSISHLTKLEHRLHKKNEKKIQVRAPFLKGHLLLAFADYMKKRTLQTNTKEHKRMCRTNPRKAVHH